MVQLLILLNELGWTEQVLYPLAGRTTEATPDGLTRSMVQFGEEGASSTHRRGLATGFVA